MKHFALTLLLSAILIGCENKDKNSSKIPITNDVQDTFIILKESKKNIPGTTTTTTTTTAEIKSTQGLILTSNALQIINKNTGSTTEIPFGKPLDQMTEIVNSILQSKPKSIGVNSECGAGPLKMATWNNGLTIVFIKKELESKTAEIEWNFAGWFLSRNSTNIPKIATMAGISVGSTRAEMESAYVITVSKTSLGYEFSTSSGLFGIFAGPDKESEITNLWSGVSCTFR